MIWAEAAVPVRPTPVRLRRASWNRLKADGRKLGSGLWTFTVHWSIAGADSRELLPKMRLTWSKRSSVRWRLMWLNSAAIDPDLRAIIGAWPGMPEEVKAEILALAQMARGGRREGRE